MTDSVQCAPSKKAPSPPKHDYTLTEPPSYKIAAQHPQWCSAMVAAFDALHRFSLLQMEKVREKAFILQLEKGKRKSKKERKKKKRKERKFIWERERERAKLFNKLSPRKKQWTIKAFSYSDLQVNQNISFSLISDLSLILRLGCCKNPNFVCNSIQFFHEP